jgi:hypothetical protein
VAVLVGGVTPAVAASRTPATRTFDTHAIWATGAYSSLGGNILATVTATPTLEGSLAITASINGDMCPKRRLGPRRECLRIAGTLTGEAEQEKQQRFLSDQPGKWLLSTGNGNVARLGPVAVVGTLMGTGFVAKGRPSIWLRVASQRGIVSLGGPGPLLGGFELP